MAIISFIVSSIKITVLTDSHVRKKKKKTISAMVFLAVTSTSFSVFFKMGIFTVKRPLCVSILIREIYMFTLALLNKYRMGIKNAKCELSICFS